MSGAGDSERGDAAIVLLVVVLLLIFFSGACG